MNTLSRYIVHILRLCKCKLSLHMYTFVFIVLMYSGTLWQKRCEMSYIVFVIVSQKIKKECCGCVCAAALVPTVLHHVVIKLFVWSSGIMDCLLIVFEIIVTHLSLSLMNDFNKTEAAIIPRELLCVLRTFPFF